MKTFVFEIRVKVPQELADNDFMAVLLDAMLGILKAFGLEIVVAGVAEDKE